MKVILKNSSLVFATMASYTLVGTIEPSSDVVTKTYAELGLTIGETVYLQLKSNTGSTVKAAYVKDSDGSSTVDDAIWFYQITPEGSEKQEMKLRGNRLQLSPNNCTLYIYRLDA